ncbi:SCO4225 family membrane protein [Streptomyces sp. WMMB 322]|uniref:SCO4225 family membrane protein n=1 Tax=Streptomyces sp. WMMB 322 TaxID=1286821 RepID=UPI0006E1DDBC|nr:hypothetical protein [Streptomyces sp. WMMB 322]SCK31031.1 hypothetical protein H180DRAFT_02439 [Streptomyces sp. WMMB 322]
MRDRSGWKRILSAATDNWPSRIYLTACAALLIWTAFDALFANDEGPSFAGVWPIFATLPTSLPVVLLAGAIGFVLPTAVTLPLFILLLAVAALVNATGLGLLLRWLRRRTSQA